MRAPNLEFVARFSIDAPVVAYHRDFLNIAHTFSGLDLHAREALNDRGSGASIIEVSFDSEVARHRVSRIGEACQGESHNVVGV